MRSKQEVETIKLQDGDYHQEEFFNYIDMAKNAVDWTIFCNYILKPNSPSGKYQILSLPNMQIAYSDMSGGIMYDFVVPKDTINITIVKEVSNKSCSNITKLTKYKILVTDDSKIYNFMHNGIVQIFDLSIKRRANSLLYDKLLKVVDRDLYDTDNLLSNKLTDILNKYSQFDRLKISTLNDIEIKVTNIVLNILNTQEAIVPYFSWSEEIVLKIREDIFKHMDGDISISELSKNYDISQKSLQNSFKSLFGFTPKEFIRLMKLNLVHHELMKLDSKDTTITKISQKWGFKHQGRFSNFYSELFLENPSITLKRTPIIDGMREDCVERKEEMML